MLVVYVYCGCTLEFDTGSFYTVNVKYMLRRALYLNFQKLEAARYATLCFDLGINDKDMEVLHLVVLQNEDSLNTEMTVKSAAVGTMTE